MVQGKQHPSSLTLSQWCTHLAQPSQPRGAEAALKVVPYCVHEGDGVQILLWRDLGRAVHADSQVLRRPKRASGFKTTSTNPGSPLPTPSMSG